MIHNPLKDAEILNQLKYSVFLSKTSEHDQASSCQPDAMVPALIVVGGLLGGRSGGLPRQEV